MAGPAHHDCGDQLCGSAAALGCSSRIHWPGMVSGEAKAAAFQGAEAFVLPSFQENFGIDEALAYGVPVLISDQVNICGEIAGAGAGLVAPATAQGVDKVPATWTASAAAARKAASVAARQLFETRFTQEAATKDIEVALLRAAKSEAQP